MKAIELANELDKLWDKSFRNPMVSKSADMLRKQAKEIEELKQIVESTIKQAFYEDDYYKLKAEYDLLKAELKNCTCQGGHSETYLKEKNENINY